MGNQTRTVAITGCGWVTPFAVGSMADVLGAASQDDSVTARGAGAATAVPDGLLAGGERFRTQEAKNERSIRLATVAIEHALTTAHLTLDDVSPDRIGLVLGCARAGQSGMIRFANEVREQSGRFVSPLHFPQTVGNYLAGALARAIKLRGPNLTLASGDASGLLAISEAAGIVATGAADIMLAGGVEEQSPELAPLQGQPDGVEREGACVFVLESTESARARGVAPLAITKERAVTLEETTDWTPAERHACSVAGSDTGVNVEGAVYIERWIGRCGACLGAAALAAIIGAARGLPVPRLRTDRTSDSDQPGSDFEDESPASALTAIATSTDGSLVSLSVCVSPSKISAPGAAHRP